MKIAITGCNGSVGNRVVLAVLKAGHAVVGIDRTPIQFHQSDPGSPDHGRPLDLEKHQSDPSFSFREADLRDYERTREALKDTDGIIHLAGIRNPGDYIAETHNTNVIISWNVLRSAAELGITRIAQASSVNVIPLVYSLKPNFQYLPLDENHPCLPDEPYGLSKVIGELQADAITRRFPSLRIASLRLSWSLPSPSVANRLQDPDRRKNDLWGYVQEDSGAQAFLLAVTNDETIWASGHEAFFIAAPETTQEEESMVLKVKFWPDVPLKEGVELKGRMGFFDCSKAKRMLGWEHQIIQIPAD